MLAVQANVHSQALNKKHTACCSETCVMQEGLIKLPVQATAQSPRLPGTQQGVKQHATARLCALQESLMMRVVQAAVTLL